MSSVRSCLVYACSGYTKDKFESKLYESEQIFLSPLCVNLIAQKWTTSIYPSVINCSQGLKMEYAGEALRGVCRLPYKNADFIVVIDRWNSFALTPSPTRGSRLYRPSESHYWSQDTPPYLIVLTLTCPAISQKARMLAALNPGPLTTDSNSFLYLQTKHIQFCYFHIISFKVALQIVSEKLLKTQGLIWQLSGPCLPAIYPDQILILVT